MTKRCALLLAGLLCSPVVAACGDEPADPFESGSFAGQHVLEVAYDCEQTLLCKMQRGTLNEGDSQERCENTTAELLNAAPDRQLRYLINVNNCANQAPCAYYDCTKADAETFGTQHQDIAMQSCQATVECQIATGALSGDAQSAYDTCVLDTILELGTYSSDEQRAYLDRHAPCAALMSCELVSCFMPVR